MSLHDLAGEGGDIQPRNWRYITSGEAISSLVAGDLITGFPDDLVQFDILATYIGYVITGPVFRRFNPEVDFSLSNSGKRVYAGWKAGSRYPSDVMQSPRFFGKFQNLTALLLDDVGEQERQRSPREARSVGVVFSADMVSTGQGVRGRAVKECRIARKITPEWESGVTQITASYRNLTNNSPEKIVQKLNLEASETANRVILDGLHHIYSGGLPGLGKR